MADLTYSATASLDGYVADADGGFDWAAPDEQVHAFVNNLVRDAGTSLYGRRVGVELSLDLLDEHRFDNGTVFLRYRVGSS